MARGGSMADSVRLVCRSAATLEVESAGFARVELEFHDTSLTFDVNPASSRSQRLGENRRRLVANICCCFGADIRLSVIWKQSEILALQIGELDFLRAWNADPSGRG